VTGKPGGGLKQLLDDLNEERERVLEISSGSTRWHFVENSIRTSLQNEIAEDGENKWPYASIHSPISFWLSEGEQLLLLLPKYTLRFHWP
jgi:hypothetical protein